MNYINWCTANESQTKKIKTYTKKHPTLLLGTTYKYLNKPKKSIKNTIHLPKNKQIPTNQHRQTKKKLKQINTKLNLSQKMPTNGNREPKSAIGQEYSINTDATYPYKPPRYGEFGEGEATLKTNQTKKIN